MADHDDRDRDGSVPWTEDDVARLTAFARSLLRDTAIGADDVVAEALAIALASHARKDRDPSGASDSHDPKVGSPAGPWLRGIVRNVIRNALRGERRRHARERTSAPRETNEPADDDPSAIAQGNESAERIRRALDRLPPPQKHVLKERYFLDRSPHSIARDLGLPGATLRSRLLRSLDALRRGLLFDRDTGFGKRANSVLFYLPRIAAAALLTVATIHLGFDAPGARPTAPPSAPVPSRRDLAASPPSTTMKLRSPFGPPPPELNANELLRLPRKHSSVAPANAAEGNEALARVEAPPHKREN